MTSPGDLAFEVQHCSQAHILRANIGATAALGSYVWFHPLPAL